MTVRTKKDQEELDALWVRYGAKLRRADKMEKRAEQLEDLAWDLSGENNKYAHELARRLNVLVDDIRREAGEVRKLIEELVERCGPVGRPLPAKAYEQAWLNVSELSESDRVTLARWVLDPATERAAMEPGLIELVAKKEAP